MVAISPCQQLSGLMDDGSRWSLSLVDPAGRCQDIRTKPTTFNFKTNPSSSGGGLGLAPAVRISETPRSSDGVKK